MRLIDSEHASELLSWLWTEGFERVRSALISLFLLKTTQAKPVTMPQAITTKAVRRTELQQS